MLAVTWLTACLDNGGDVIPPAVEEPEQEEPDAPESEESTHHFLMGSLFSFQKNLRNGVDAANGGTASTTFYNKPLFEAKTFAATDEEWWDNLVEEFVYSGLDYVAANCRGRLPRADENPKYELDHGDPTRIKDLIAALKRRDVKDLKIAIFDDCPASWDAARNYDLYGKYSTVLSSSEQQSLKLSDEEVVYPLDDLEAIYKYIWDYNIKLAFQNFYGENAANNDYLFRYNGKPVLYLWSINGFLNVEYAALGGKRISCTGKLKNILEKIREDFKATFGESLTWVELPFRSGKSLLKLRYASQEEAEVCFAVDGEKCAGVKLPATDGAWKEQEVAAVHFDRKAWHEVTLHFLSGRVEVNCFNICAVSE